MVSPSPPSAASAGGGLWSDLPRRSAVLSIGIPMVGWMLSRPLTAWLFFQGAHLGAAWEWLLLLPAEDEGKDKPKQRFHAIMYCFPLVSCLVANASILQQYLLSTSKAENDSDTISSMDLMMFLLVVAAASFSLASGGDRSAIISTNHLIKGLVALTLPFAAWNRLCTTSAMTTIYLLAVVWNCDNGALIVGRLARMSNRKFHIPLLPSPLWLQRVSPAKSVEGILGGLAGGCATSTAWPWICQQFLQVYLQQQSPASWTTGGITNSMETSMTERCIVGLGLSVMAIAGDLWESSIKRQGGVKDSGKLLPGHGGILDRFDSSLLPVLFYSYYYKKQMGP